MAIGRRLLAGALALVAMFGLLSAGAAVAHEAMVSSPVARAMRLHGVRAYTLDTAGAAPTLTVRLANGVDLESLCEAVDARLSGVLGQAPVLRMRGPGQARLTPLVEAAALPVAQGIATGQFVPMARSVETLARQAGATVRVEVDASAVYLTIRPSGGGAEAYAVFPRPVASSAVGGASS